MQAEQSAAHLACDQLNPTRQRPRLSRLYSQQSTVHKSYQHLMSPPPILVSNSLLSMNHSMKHMPSQYTDSEQFIIDLISSDGGRIRKIWAPDEQGRYQFEITGTYRYCENVRRAHRKNHIYFIVHPVKKTYCQKCHDPECFGFQSAIKAIPTVKRKPDSSTNNSFF
jgi:hypothetical protein